MLLYKLSVPGNNMVKLNGREKNCSLQESEEEIPILGVTGGSEESTENDKEPGASLTEIKINLFMKGKKSQKNR